MDCSSPWCTWWPQVSGPVQSTDLLTKRPVRSVPSLRRDNIFGSVSKPNSAKARSLRAAFAFDRVSHAGSSCGGRVAHVSGLGQSTDLAFFSRVKVDPKKTDHQVHGMIQFMVFA